MVRQLVSHCLQDFLQRVLVHVWCRARPGPRRHVDRDQGADEPVQVFRRVGVVDAEIPPGHERHRVELPPIAIEIHRQRVQGVGVGHGGSLALAVPDEASAPACAAAVALAQVAARVGRLQVRERVGAATGERNDVIQVAGAPSVGIWQRSVAEWAETALCAVVVAPEAYPLAVTQFPALWRFGKWTRLGFPLQRCPTLVRPHKPAPAQVTAIVEAAWPPRCRGRRLIGESEPSRDPLPDREDCRQCRERRCVSRNDHGPREQHLNPRRIIRE